MKLEEYLKIGQLVAIEVADGHGTLVRYRSRIEYIAGKELQLAAPIKDRSPVYLHSGEQVKIFFWDCFTAYELIVKVVYSVIEPIPLVVVASLDKLSRVQQREFVRAHYSIDVKIGWTDATGEFHEKKCSTKDISGGGMMLILTKKTDLKKDTTVTLEFTITDKFFKTEGRVAWSDWDMNSDGILRNTLGIKFTSLTENERKHLVKSVFQRQIELRRKGML